MTEKAARRPSGSARHPARVARTDVTVPLAARRGRAICAGAAHSGSPQRVLHAGTPRTPQDGKQRASRQSSLLQCRTDKDPSTTQPALQKGAWAPVPRPPWRPGPAEPKRHAADRRSQCICSRMHRALPHMAALSGGSTPRTPPGRPYPWYSRERIDFGHIHSRTHRNERRQNRYPDGQWDS